MRSIQRSLPRCLAAAARSERPLKPTHAKAPRINRLLCMPTHQYSTVAADAMEPRVNTSKHTNTILSLQCDACLQEQFHSKSEFGSQTRYTRTHIEVAQRKTITLSPALSHLPHTLTVELPMMPSSWVTSWRGQNLVPRTNQP